jgi:hypothetical protein
MRELAPLHWHVRRPPAVPQSPPKRTPELLTALSPSFALASLLSVEHTAAGVACCSLCRPSPGPGVALAGHGWPGCTIGRPPPRLPGWPKPLAGRPNRPRQRVSRLCPVKRKKKGLIVNRNFLTCSLCKIARHKKLHLRAWLIWVKSRVPNAKFLCWTLENRSN